MYETLVLSQQLHGDATVRNFQGLALVSTLMNLYCEKVDPLCLIKHLAMNTCGGVEVLFHQCSVHLDPVIHWLGDWLGSIAGLDAVEKIEKSLHLL
jgi:hypothetical protein